MDPGIELGQSNSKCVALVIRSFCRITVQGYQRQFKSSCGYIRKIMIFVGQAQKEQRNSKRV